MSKYGPKEKSAFELAKEYGIFPEDVQENDYLTNGELCQVFMYLYDHFRPVVHKPLKDGTLKNHPCRVAFQQCVKHGLCTDSENFISKIDEITTSVMVYRFADDFLTDSDIEYDFYDTTDTLEEVYQVEDFPNDLIQFTAGMVAVVTIDIAKLYIKDIVQRFRGFALKRQYRESVALLLEHRCMAMLFPPAIQEHCYMLDLLTTYPEVNEFHLNHKVIFDYLFKSSYMPV